MLRARATGGAQEAKATDDRLFLYRPYHRTSVSSASRWKSETIVRARRNPAKDPHDRMLVCDNEFVLSLPPPLPSVACSSLLHDFHHSIEAAADVRCFHFTWSVL